PSSSAQRQDPRLHHDVVRHLRARASRSIRVSPRSGRFSRNFVGLLNEDLCCHSYKLKVGQL
ncbi:Hypothetical protein FKW44_000350, partial [Caligus rogercresseyi]